jgi:hypothetical protein
VNVNEDIWLDNLPFEETTTTWSYASSDKPREKQYRRNNTEGLTLFEGNFANDNWIYTKSIFNEDQIQDLIQNLERYNTFFFERGQHRSVSVSIDAHSTIY